VGDARATEMGLRRGEVNIGEIVRKRHGRDALLLVFTTHHGTVTAASDWKEPAQRKTVRPALAGSYERVFHDTGLPRFLLDLRTRDAASSALREPKLERAIAWSTARPPSA
jgi:erythromycin esterase-like protein